MGITFGLLEQLRSRGVFESSACKVLDIGSSNLYSASEDQVKSFVRQFSAVKDDAELSVFAARIARGSGYDPVKGGLNESFVGELLERCGMTYHAFDIAKGYGTTIFDLNQERITDRWRGSFDAVLNIGTTEHVVNQFNSFEVIHDAVRSGGYMVHQLPVSGFSDHGYFVYTGRMFFELASFNQYDIVDLWYDGPAGHDELMSSVRSYKSYFPKLASVPEFSLPIPNVALTIIYRKTRDAPFAACLETSTSVGGVDAGVKLAYAARAISKVARVVRRGSLAQWVSRVIR